MNDLFLGLAVAAIFLGGVLVGFGARNITWRPARSLPAHAAPVAAERPAAVTATVSAPVAAVPVPTVPTVREDIGPAMEPPAQSSREPKPGDTIYALSSAAENYALIRGTVLAADANRVRIAELPDVVVAPNQVFLNKRDAQREAHLRLERLVRALGMVPRAGSGDGRMEARKREFDERLAALKALEAEMSRGESGEA